MRLIDADALEAKMYHEAFETDTDLQKWDSGCWIRYKMFEEAIEAAPTVDRPQGEWIPCSERLPKDLEVVNITWINHRPMTYYADIKDKPFTATAIHYKDKWWWYSPICEDMLAEYGKSECDKMDADIEVTAWMALPEPWEGGR